MGIEYQATTFPSCSATHDSIFLDLTLSIWVSRLPFTCSDNCMRMASLLASAASASSYSNQLKEWREVDWIKCLDGGEVEGNMEEGIRDEQIDSCKRTVINLLSALQKRNKCVCVCVYVCACVWVCVYVCAWEKGREGDRERKQEKWERGWVLVKYNAAHFFLSFLHLLFPQDISTALDISFVLFNFALDYWVSFVFFFE